jgi:uncharacterized protein YcfJ
MNKSLLLGVVAGVGVATAGGVLGYQFLGQPQADDQGSAVIAEEEVAVALAEPAATTAPAPTARPAAPRAAAPKPAAAPVEECWDEEVTVQEEPTDKHQIGGTAAGAAVGGAIAKDVSDGDSDLATAAGRSRRFHRSQDPATRPGKSRRDAHRNDDRSGGACPPLTPH